MLILWIDQQQGLILMEDDYEMFKIVIIGSTGTGKTNIATRYIRNEFNESQKATVGVEFLSKIVQVRNQNIKVTLWDTAGQERYKSLSKVYYKGASGVLIVYDATEPQSYLDVESWMRLANENLNLNEVVLMVVGNKIDLENQRKVPADRPLREYKDKFDIDTWEVSAKTGYNVREIFAELLQRIYQKNIEIRSSAIHDPSQYGSVVDHSIVAGPVRKTNQPPARQTQAPEVIIEETYDQKLKPETIKKLSPPPPAPQSKPAPSKAVKAENRITLNAAHEKERKQQAKKKKGCC